MSEWQLVESIDAGSVEEPGWVAVPLTSSVENGERGDAVIDGLWHFVRIP